MASRDFARLPAGAAIGPSFASLSAEAAAPAQRAALWANLGRWAAKLSAQRALPAACRRLALSLPLRQLSPDLAARRAPAARPLLDAPYGLPGRVAVALTAAARARR